MERAVIYLDILLACYHPEVLYNVWNTDAVEVIDLASAEDGWDYLVLFCGGEYEDGVSRWFFQRLEESVES